jgi:hypothetical protein
MTTTRRSIAPRLRRPLTIRNTSIYLTAEVKELIHEVLKEMACPGRGICINVRNTDRGVAGRAYDSVPTISNAPPTAQYLVAIRLGQSGTFPCWHQGYEPPTIIQGRHNDPPLRALTEPKAFRRWPLIVLPSWRHGLVYIAAHELMHIEQFRHRLPASEVQCEWAAHRVLNKIFP